VTGEAVFDGLGTLAIGALLVAVGTFLAIEMQSLLLGEAAVPEQQTTIAATAAAVPGIGKVVHMRTQHLSPDDVLVALKVDFDPGMSAAEAGEVINACEARIRAAVPIATRIYVEPAAASDAPGGSGREAEHS
jgi:divalent metal cation (Fe/Co/Zn/Cd) transporter